MPSLFSDIKYWTNLTLTPIGIASNILLLYLIKNHSSKGLTDYKNVLYLGNLTDLIYGTLHFLTNTETTLLSGVYFIFNRGVLGYLPSPWTLIVYPFTIFMIYFSYINVWIQFVYRYFLVCRNITFKGWKFVILTAFGASLVSLHPAYNIYHFITRVRTDKDFAYLLNGTDWMINGQYPPYGAYSLLQDGPNEQLPITSIHMQYLKITYLLISYIMIIFFAVSIFLTVQKSESQISGTSHKYQRQISIVMTIEAIVPLFTLIIPILLDLLNIVTGIRIAWTGVVALFLIGFAPVFNPIVKLLVISCYRIWIFQTLKLGKFFETTSSSVQVFSTHTNSHTSRYSHSLQH